MPVEDQKQWQTHDYSTNLGLRPEPIKSNNDVEMLIEGCIIL